MNKQCCQAKLACCINKFNSHCQGKCLLSPQTLYWAGPRLQSFGPHCFSGHPTPDDDGPITRGQDGDRTWCRTGLLFSSSPLLQGQGIQSKMAPSHRPTGTSPTVVEGLTLGLFTRLTGGDLLPYLSIVIPL